MSKQISILVVVLSIALAGSFTREIHAQCSATVTQTYQLQSGPCPALTETRRWQVRWSTGIFDSLENTGDGTCPFKQTGEQPTENDCWAEFYDPEVRNWTSSGIHQGETTQTTYNSEFNSGLASGEAGCRGIAPARTVRTPIRTCPSTGGGGSGCTPDGYTCKYPNTGGGCPAGYNIRGDCGTCCYGSPVLIDVDGDGFDLTDAFNGVQFDLGGSGYPNQIAWTAPDSDDAWLALDRNSNGTVDNGKELFGNFTEQPASTERNGFLALAVFDQPTQGGNADGVIDSQDAVFTNLRLWQDRNHNGVSEASELFALPALDVEAIELNYRESKRTDQHGNRFRYRAKVKDAKGAKVNRWAWDVFPVVNPPPL